MTSFEQFQSAQRSSLEAFFGLGAKALEGAEKLAALNLQTARRLLSESQETMRATVSSKNPQELVARQFSAQTLTDATDKAIAYWHHASEIVTATADEIARLIEADASEAKTRWSAMLEVAAKNAPAGTENVVALMRTALDGMNHAHDGMRKATRRAAEGAATHFERITDSARKSAAGAAGRRHQHAEA